MRLPFARCDMFFVCDDAGDAENARPENDGQRKLWVWKMQEWKMTDKNYGVWKMQDLKMTDHVN